MMFNVQMTWQLQSGFQKSPQQSAITLKAISNNTATSAITAAAAVSTSACDDTMTSSWSLDDVRAALDGTLAYHNPHSGSRDVGRPMRIDSRYVTQLIQPLADSAQSMGDINVEDFVFATGCSTNHYRASQVSINRLVDLFPNKTILFFDFGLQPAEIAWVCYEICQ